MNPHDKQRQVRQEIRHQLGKPHTSIELYDHGIYVKVFPDGERNKRSMLLASTVGEIARHFMDILGDKTDEEIQEIVSAAVSLLENPKTKDIAFEMAVYTAVGKQQPKPENPYDDLGGMFS